MNTPSYFLPGAATVFTDLERGAVAVVKSMGKETSKTVGHKYGEDAGQVTDDSLAVAAHGINLTAVRVVPSSIPTYLLLGRVGARVCAERWLSLFPSDYMILYIVITHTCSYHIRKLYVYLASWRYVS